MTRRLYATRSPEDCADVLKGAYTNGLTGARNAVLFLFSDVSESMSGEYAMMAVAEHTAKIEAQLLAALGEQSRLAALIAASDTALREAQAEIETLRTRLAAFGDPSLTGGAAT